ncbi:Sin3 binding region of histone deacetylase complex subunit SAP30 [Fragilaria crotonensis]|nr:Sin3 binding region of histone deacetylase complex subunit SAP30 [Fragilaria crotonensis]
MAAPSTVLTASGGSTKQQRRTSQKAGHSRSYPRGVGLDFRKLAGLTLFSYIDHHGVNVRAEAPPSELAVAVARHFESMDVDEEACIGGFLSKLEGKTDYARKTAYFDGRALLLLQGSGVAPNGRLVPENKSPRRLLAPTRMVLGF